MSHIILIELPPSQLWQVCFYSVQYKLSLSPSLSLTSSHTLSTQSPSQALILPAPHSPSQALIPPSPPAPPVQHEPHCQAHSTECQHCAHNPSNHTRVRQVGRRRNAGGVGKVIISENNSYH